MVSGAKRRDKQRELDELKSKFVASVSHELRTPLVSIEKSISLILVKKKTRAPMPNGSFFRLPKGI